MAVDFCYYWHTAVCSSTSRYRVVVQPAKPHQYFFELSAVWQTRKTCPTKKIYFLYEIYSSKLSLKHLNCLNEFTRVILQCPLSCQSLDLAMACQVAPLFIRNKGSQPSRMFKARNPTLSPINITKIIIVVFISLIA